MKKTEHIRMCDKCGKQVREDPNQYGGSAFRGWFFVTTRLNEPMEWDLCGMACLQTLADSFKATGAAL